MDINLIRNLITVASFAVFLWIIWSAFAPSRKAEHEQNGRLPFDGDDQ